MSEKSGTSPAVISLPKGGGAQQGIGETFSPDLFTGTGNLTIPIALPKGRNGFQPKLELLYSTGADNSAFGLGFNLNIAGIARKTSKGVPRYDDARDIFVLSGGEDLVPVEVSPPDVRYRPRIEGTFADIVHRRDGEGDRWIVTGKDGLTSIYGETPSAGAVIADPLRRDHIFQWKLAETRDPYGNRIVHEYEHETVEVGPRPRDQVYLRRLRYVDSTADDGSTHWLVSVIFRYQERPDPFSVYKSGFEVRTARRCTAIEIWTHAGADRLARSYRLIYLDQRDELPDLARRLPRNGVSLLSRIRVRGGGEDDPRPAGTRELPPLDFEYSRLDPSARRLIPLQGPELPLGSLAHPNVELASLFGNGLPDVVELGRGITYWRNLGGGRFDRPRTMERAPGEVSLEDPRVQLLDADGDGRIDLVSAGGRLSGYFPLGQDGEWDRASFHRFEGAPSFTLPDPEVRFVDLDGDGVTDAMRSGDQLECFYFDRDRGWWKSERSSRAPRLSLSDPRVRLADMSGDGLQDLVLVHDGSVDYWPNLGYGRFGERISMRGAPRLPWDYDPRRVLLGDVDGDGLADLIYAGDGFVRIWLNRGGDGFAGEPIEIEGTPRVYHPGAIRLIDLLGTGVAGLLYTGDPSHPGRDRHFFLDLSGGTKPYLLEKMTNHLGAEVRVEYRSSTEYYLQDEAKPETRWRTTLPFPLQVVASVESRDLFSETAQTRTFAYHHGYWDGAERELRGFARVDTRDALRGAPGAVPTEQRTWFHLGPVGPGHGAWFELELGAEHWGEDPDLFERPGEMSRLLAGMPRRLRRDAIRSLKGRELRSELYALDEGPLQDRPYLVTEKLHALRRVAEGENIFFPHQARERTTFWERGDDPLTRLSVTEEYDAYGQLEVKIDVACPRGWRSLDELPGAPFLATRTRTGYALPDPQARVPIRDRMARVTTWGLLNEGELRVPDLLAIGEDGVFTELLSDTRSYYDGPAWVGLAHGTVGDFGALVRAEKLVLTEELLAARGGELPPYLAPDAPPLWTDEYPDEFRALCPPLAGYEFEPGRGYWANTERRRYDFHDPAAVEPRGAVEGLRDPLGRESTVAYDAYTIFPAQVTNPVGLSVTAEYDYSAFAARAITDENGNRTVAGYSALGLIERVSKMGQGEGDTEDRPGIVYAYDFLAYFDRGEPISVRTTRRLRHGGEETVTSLEYSDGFGRLLQTRLEAGDLLFGDPVFAGGVLPPDQAANLETAAELPARPRAPGEPPNVVVSGASRYDEKGRQIEKYEPYFDVGSESRTIRGIPTALDDPDHFTPTPWEAYSYDANDLAPLLHLSGRAGASHHFTPASIVLDALGRVVEATQRAGVDPRDWSTTHTRYRLDGNILAVEDALGREAASFVYDLAGQVIRTDSIDAGTCWVVFDAGGAQLERRDGKGALVLHTYDRRGRPAQLHARDREGEELTLRERTEYGDSGDPAQPEAEREAARAHNLLGAPVRQYDQAGLVRFEDYDLEGRPVEKVRRTVNVDSLREAFGEHLDWEPPPGVTLAELVEQRLDPTEYRTSRTYDALGRIERLRYPEDAHGLRSELVPEYDPAGKLERLTLDGQVYVDRIAHDAGGRRTLILHGNGVMTRHAYDPRTGRLQRLRSERFLDRLEEAAPGIRPDGHIFQDYAYEYDLSGNLTRLRDRTPGSGLAPQPDRLDRDFEHDALYRLTRATGRESDRAQADPNALRPYVEEYRYDAAGNLTRLTHRDDSGGFVRDLTLEPGSNRLAQVDSGQLSTAYVYDACGNLIHEGGARHLAWDHANRLHGFRVQPDAADPPAEPSLETHYLYDFAGARTAKLTRLQGGAFEVTVYIDGIFEHERRIPAAPAQPETANTSAFVLDDERRIVSVRVGPAFPGDGTPAIKYELADHLGSSQVVLDDAGGDISHEEFTPYGETSFGGHALKRYRFTGQERDAESGYYHHGARQYAPWIARWISPDPEHLREGVLNAYRYVGGRPMGLRDPDGNAGKPGPEDKYPFDPVAAVKAIDARVAAAKSSIPAGTTEAIHERLFTPEEVWGALAFGLIAPWLGAGFLVAADAGIGTSISGAKR